MTSDQFDRESSRVRELAEEYLRRGYKVIVPSGPSDLPEFLKGSNYIPDLLVTSDAENLVVEVKTSNSLKGDKRLAAISEIVSKQPGWQFVFVLTNPKQQTSRRQLHIVSRWQELFDKSRHPSLLENPELSDAAFLLAWSALEGLLRSEMDTQVSSNRKFKSSLSLLRDAVIHGLLDREELPKLESFFRTRNSILHSTDGSIPNQQDVADLQRCIVEIRRNLMSARD